VGSVAANGISATSLASNAITSAKIADGTITSSKFGAGAITATVIATDAIDADALAADAIAEINATVDTALADYDAPTNAEMTAAFTQIKGATWAAGTDTLEAIRDRGDAAWVTATSVTVSDKTGFSLAADQSGVTVGTVNTLTGHTAQTADHTANIAAILADTGELQTDLTDGGRLDLLIDGILEDTGNTLPATLATAQADLDTLTGADGATLATLQANYAPATAAAVAALNDLSAAQVNAEVVDVLRTDTIPDSYAAHEAQPTFAQAVLAILQFLTEKSVSTTTVTIKKPDGSTSTGMTFTLDDASDPTSITRAT
jgi:hypothetical protein